MTIGWKMYMGILAANGGQIHSKSAERLGAYPLNAESRPNVGRVAQEVGERLVADFAIAGAQSCLHPSVCGAPITKASSEGYGLDHPGQGGRK